MKHHILLEFTSSKPLPTDFLDLIAGRVYIMDVVDKADCSAIKITQSQVDLLNGVDQDEIPAILKRQAA